MIQSFEPEPTKIERVLVGQIGFLCNVCGVIHASPDGSNPGMATQQPFLNENQTLLHFIHDGHGLTLLIVMICSAKVQSIEKAEQVLCDILAGGCASIRDG